MLHGAADPWKAYSEPEIVSDSTRSGSSGHDTNTQVPTELVQTIRGTIGLNMIRPAVATVRPLQYQQVLNSAGQEVDHLEVDSNAAKVSSRSHFSKENEDVCSSDSQCAIIQTDNLKREKAFRALSAQIQQRTWKGDPFQHRAAKQIDPKSSPLGYAEAIDETKMASQIRASPRSRSHLVIDSQSLGGSVGEQFTQSRFTEVERHLPELLSPEEIISFQLETENNELRVREEYYYREVMTLEAEVKRLREQLDSDLNIREDLPATSAPARLMYAEDLKEFKAETALSSSLPSTDCSCSDSVVQAVRPPNYDDSTIAMRILNVEGKCIAAFKFHRLCQVSQVQEKLCMLKGAHADLRFKDKILTDTMTLEECGLPARVTLTMDILGQKLIADLRSHAADLAASEVRKAKMKRIRRMLDS